MSNRRMETMVYSNRIASFLNVFIRVETYYFHQQTRSVAYMILFPKHGLQLFLAVTVGLAWFKIETDTGKADKMEANIRKMDKMLITHAGVKNSRLTFRVRTRLNDQVCTYDSQNIANWPRNCLQLITDSYHCGPCGQDIHHPTIMDVRPFVGASICWHSCCPDKNHHIVIECRVFSGNCNIIQLWYVWKRINT